MFFITFEGFFCCFFFPWRLLSSCEHFLFPVLLFVGAWACLTCAARRRPSCSRTASHGTSLCTTSTTSCARTRTSGRTWVTQTRRGKGREREGVCWGGRLARQTAPTVVSFTLTWPILAWVQKSQSSLGWNGIVSKTSFDIENIWRYDCDVGLAHDKALGEINGMEWMIWALSPCLNK